MQRISVDLPEPDGPQMTIFSPLRTVRLMFLRTWKAPNHLLRPTIRIATSRSLALELPQSVPVLSAR